MTWCGCGVGGVKQLIIMGKYVDYFTKKSYFLGTFTFLHVLYSNLVSVSYISYVNSMEIFALILSTVLCQVRGLIGVIHQT